MYKAIFIAPTYHQAAYWANQWGFTKNEWSYVNNEQVFGIYGWWLPEIPTFVCGTDAPSSELWFELATRGFNVYDAEDLNVALHTQT